MVWTARNAADYWPATALAQATIGATAQPMPGEQDRHALLTAIVYHHVRFLVFIGGNSGGLPAVNPPPVMLDRWTLIWPTACPPEYPPSAKVDGAELTRTMIDHRAWYPLSNIKAFQRSPFPPETIHRN
jgi:hypothetical protein